MEFTGERYVPELSGDIRLEHLHRYEWCLDYIKDKRVLDIASGEGYGSLILSSNASSVIGMDISSAAIEHAQKKYGKKNNLEFKQGNAADISLPSALVDVVVSFETIEHHDRHEEMLSEIRRVLIDDGLLIISSPNKLIYSDLAGGSHNDFHVKELYFDEFRELLSRYFGFVKFYGQRVTATSLMWPQEQQSCDKQLKVFTEGKVGSIQESVPKEIEPMYYVALASNAPLPVLAATSALFSELNNPFWDKQREALMLGKEVRRLSDYIAEVHDVLRIRDTDLANLNNEFTRLHTELADANHELTLLRLTVKGWIIKIIRVVKRKISATIKN